MQVPRLALLASALTACALAPAAEEAREAELLPRSALLAPAAVRSPQYSPDGASIAWLATGQDGVDDLWVGPADEIDQARLVNRGDREPVRSLRWAYTNRHLLYTKDSGGDENGHLLVLDLSTGARRDLTPRAGIQARIEGLSSRRPTEVIVGLNERDARFHDLYRMNLETGARKLLYQNDGFLEFHLDDMLEPRLAVRVEEDGSVSILARHGESGFSREVATIPFEDTLSTKVLGVGVEATKAYLADSRGRDTAALVEIDLGSGKTRVLATDAKADVEDFVRHPRTGQLQAATSVFDRRRWYAFDEAFGRDLDAVGRLVGDADLEIASRTLADDRWIVAVHTSNTPVFYVGVDRKRGTVTELFPKAAPPHDRFAKMEPVLVPTRDGLGLMGYLTRPRRRTSGVMPLVLLVHGGPWIRDRWGFDANHQWLADRGYAVLAVNFRGSVGLGKRLANLGDGEWGAAMQDDLLDAVRWAIAQGIADPRRVAIMGASYGGYATLTALASTDDFACGVDLVGPSNLITLLEGQPAYWQGELEQTVRRVGDHRTAAGRAQLLARSPLTLSDRIRRPLLVGQGANDPRVRRSESDQIVAALEARGVAVTYLLFEDEGHGLSRPANRRAWAAATEAFLGRCLGGPHEAVDLRGSTAKVLAGAHHVDGLAEAAARLRQ